MKNKLLFFTLSMLYINHPLMAENFATTTMLMNTYSVRNYDNVWERLKSGFKLNHTQNKQVRYYEKLYTKSPKHFLKLLTNANPYIYYLLVEVERYGLPSELALLPAVESSFNPNAYSGMWQFIGITAKRFNLTTNDDIDERQNVVRSTKAAVIYLSYLNRVFKQWEPAIGAYNCGEGCMYQAILNSRQTLGDVDYYELKLPTVTKNYLPKLIALANIINNPKKFGVTLPKDKNVPYFAITYPQTGTKLSQIKQSSDTPSSVFEKLNPQFKSSSYTLSNKDTVLLPVKNQTLYYASINQTTTPVVDIAQNTTDENLDDAINQIALANDDNVEVVDNSDTATIHDNDNTKAPIEVAAVDGNNVKSAPLDNATATTVETETGSTGTVTTGTVTTGAVATVSAGTNLDVEGAGAAVVADNSATPNLHHAATNNAHDSVDDDTDDDTHTIKMVKKNSGSPTYVVKPGDTLYSIAKAHNIDVATIKKMNQIPGNNLSVGQTLVLHTKSTNI